MRTTLVLVAALALLALAPVASADALQSYCYGHTVGWEGYVRYCVHPNDPECLVERTFYNLGEEWRTCVGV